MTHSIQAEIPTSHAGEELIATIYEALRGNPELFARTLLLITYDEHGGLYDHRAPLAGVPAPGGGRSLGASILHALWHRKAQKFDFTMLGLRVPAVIVSPLIDAGTVIHQVHDHASVPSTLRALFAPSAEPLTRRDAWAAPFHDAATRTVPRTDLPDLAEYAHRAAAPAAAAPDGAAAADGAAGLAAASPAPADAAAAPAPSGAAAEGQVPEYYRDFIRQSELVRGRLRKLGEPEMSAAAAPAGIPRAMQTSQAFAQAAHRHRHG